MSESLDGFLKKVSVDSIYNSSPLATAASDQC